MPPKTASCRRWQAAAHGGADALELATVELPAPSGRDIAIRVEATTATYTDLLVLRGSYMPRFSLPLTPGYDCVGVVTAVGEHVKALKPGDRVAAMPQHGCMAEVVILPEAECVQIDGRVPADKAVCVVLTGVTAYQLIHRASGGRLSRERVNADTAVLVHGAAGGTGAMLVELLKLAGVKRIFGTCSARNAGAVRSAGAVPLDYAAGEKDDGKRWDARVRAETGGRGVDVVFDAVVSGGYLARGTSCLAHGGKYVAYGFTRSDAPGAVDVPAVLADMTRLAAQQCLLSWMPGCGSNEAEFHPLAARRAAAPADFAADLATLLSLVADGKLRPVVGRVWGFEQAADALRSIERGEHRGKQVITIGGGGVGLPGCAQS